MYDRVPAYGPINWAEFIASNTTSHNFAAAYLRNLAEQQDAITTKQKRREQVLRQHEDKHV